MAVDVLVNVRAKWLLVFGGERVEVRLLLEELDDGYFYVRKCKELFYTHWVWLCFQLGLRLRSSGKVDA